MSMPLSHYMKDAWLNLSTRKLRSCLALLGILIGTASLVSLLILGELAIHHVTDQFKAMGTNLIRVSIWSRAQPKETNQEPLTLRHIAQLKQTTAGVQSIIPVARVDTQLTWHNHSLQGTVMATSYEIEKISKIKLDQGRFLTLLDQQSPLCVIGSDMAQKLRSLGMLNPIGQQLSLNNTFFTIIGVLAPYTPNFVFPIDFNHGIFTPFSTELSTKKPLVINEMFVVLHENINHTPVEGILESRLRMWGGPKALISFATPEGFIKMFRNQTRTLEIELGLVGAIALVVGGVGIMNIMLVSVAERRREIGIRLAIGATPSNIRLMFLIEAILLSLAGGVLGILFSLLVTYIAAYFVGWHYFVPRQPVVLGCLLAGSTGVFFGYYPAYNASKLQPVDALREE